VLVVLGLSFAGANLWFTAVRSTIPLELRGKVAQKQRLIEKTLGVDDVYLVTFASHRRIQVDGPVFDALVLNRAVTKSAWSRTLQCNGRMTGLDWSSDFHGMLWTMPLIAILLVFLGMWTIVKLPTDIDYP